MKRLLLTFVFLGISLLVSGLDKQPIHHFATGIVHKDPGHTHMTVCFSTKPGLRTHLDLVFASGLDNNVLYTTKGQIINPAVEEDLEHWTQIVVSYIEPPGCP